MTQIRTKAEQETLFNNDARLLKLFGANQRGTEIVIPAEWFPDGREFAIDLKGIDQMTPELRMRCVKLARDQYNARIDEQEAAADSRAEARGAADDAADTSTAEPGGGTVAGEETVQGSEKGMEEYLQSQVTRLEGRRDYLKSLIRKQQDSLIVLQDKKAYTEAELKVGQQLLEQYRCMTDSLADSQEKSCATETSTPLKKQRSGSKKGSTSTKKTARKSTTKSKNSAPSKDQEYEARER